MTSNALHKLLAKPWYQHQLTAWQLRKLIRNALQEQGFVIKNKQLKATFFQKKDIWPSNLVVVVAKDGVTIRIIKIQAVL